MKWVEKRIGAIGYFRVGGRVFTLPESGKGKLCHFGGIYGGLGGLTGPPGSQMVDLRPDVLDEVG